MKVSSKKDLNYLKLPSSVERMTETWLSMLSNTRVEHGRWSGVVGHANRLVATDEEELESVGLAMARSRSSGRCESESDRYHVREDQLERTLNSFI